MPDAKVILITAAATGFGRQIAMLLAQSGYRVFGTSRQSRDLLEYPILTLDVTNDDSARRCVEQVLTAAGRIDVLVNNAGYVLNGVVEEVGIDQGKTLFDVNVFGCARMIKHVLPVMRKQQSGNIINISSLAGRVGTPGHGYYSASKFALEGLTEALSHEVRPFNIHCTLVEPGYFRTDIVQNTVPPAESIDDYGRIREKLYAGFRRGIDRGRDPIEVARLVKRIIETPSPKLRYPIGPGNPWVLWAKCLLPQKLFARGVRKYFRLPSSIGRA